MIEEYLRYNMDYPFKLYVTLNVEYLRFICNQSSIWLCFVGMMVP